MKDVLSVASECAPLVKTGGLADVAGALPHAMAGQGWRLRTLIPGYPAVLAKAGVDPHVVLDTDDLLGVPARVLSARIAGLDLLILEAPDLFDRQGTLYLDGSGRDWPDNPRRFAALSMAAARIATEGADGWRPDVVHCHDWQAGLVPYYLRGRGVPTVMTVHNVAFQGLAHRDMLDRLSLDPADFTAEGLEFWGQISALKAGLVWADRITTVSPTYADELTTPDFGAGLDGVFRARIGVLSGILNGIDTDVWNPATDPYAPTYDDPDGKAAATDDLRGELGLPPADGPLCVLISRLSHQKGIDLLIDALPALLRQGGQLAVLGSGDASLEAAVREAGQDPNVAVIIGYDEALSHRMVAGGDAILVPSRFEPCGLTQLMGLRYGTIPVVAHTGGLADTVIDANEMALRSGVATGFQVAPLSAHTLSRALVRVCEVHADRPAWRRMMANAMAQTVAWDGSAAAYARLYDEVAGPA